MSKPLADKLGMLDEGMEILKKNSSKIMKGSLIGGGILLAGSTAAHFLMKGQDKLRSEGMKGEARKEQRRRDRETANISGQYEANLDPTLFDDMLQNLYGQRKGHSRSWGGRKY